LDNKTPWEALRRVVGFWMTLNLDLTPKVRPGRFQAQITGILRGIRNRIPGPKYPLIRTFNNLADSE